MTIGDYSFKNTIPASMVIPASITSIGGGVFNGCTKLANFEAKDGSAVLNMGSNSYDKGLFYDCPLKSVKIGRNLEYSTSSSYGYSPFYRNTNIETVIFTDVPTEVFTNEFYGCSGIKDVSLGDGVTKIGNYAFSGCSSIETFSFGNSLESIGAEAFSDCTNMTKLYAEPQTPPTCGNQALDDINKWNCTLIVPAEAKAAYAAADQWKEFFFMEDGEFVDGNSAVEVFDGVKTSYSSANAEAAVASAKSANALFFSTKETDAAKENFVVGGKAKKVKLTDAQPFYSPADIAAETVEYCRDFKNTGWQALYVPFALKYSEWADKADVAYVNAVHQYDDDGDGSIDRTTLEFFTQTGGELKANTPYMIRPKQTGATTFSAANRTIVATPAEDAYVDCSSTTRYYKISGTYQPRTDMNQLGNYAPSGGTFKLVSNGSTLSPFRIYLSMTERGAGNGSYKSKPRQITISVDGEEIGTTDITGPVSDDNGSETYFDLQGRRVSAPAKAGIYIRNGRKVVVR